MNGMLGTNGDPQHTIAVNVAQHDGDDVDSKYVVTGHDGGASTLRETRRVRAEDARIGEESSARDEGDFDVKPAGRRRPNALVPVVDDVVSH